MDKINNRINELFPECLVNINGQIYSPDEAKISVFDRGFLYGDSVYEVTKATDKKIIFLNEHIDRLFHSAELIAMPLQYSKKEVKETILETLERTQWDSTYIRFIITRGVTSMGLDAPLYENNMITIVKELPPWPSEWYEKGVAVFITKIQRNDPKATDPNAKSGNYLNNVLAHLDARKHDYYDAIMVNKEEKITEATTSNVWMVKDSTVYTPPLKSGLLKGITRTKILEILVKQNMKFEEKEFNINEFLQADEAFLTSSTKGIVPIHQINDKEFAYNGMGTITSILNKQYNKLVNTPTH